MTPDLSLSIELFASLGGRPARRYTIMAARRLYTENISRMYITITFPKLIQQFPNLLLLQTEVNHFKLSDPEFDERTSINMDLALGCKDIEV
uniref:Uncharacterized protein n=1 Tax=Lepeophtheirus salmonis TaxID=72036 RepID=A0A0K2TG29_LEPSM